MDNTAEAHNTAEAQIAAAAVEEAEVVAAAARAEAEAAESATAAAVQAEEEEEGLYGTLRPAWTAMQDYPIPRWKASVQAEAVAVTEADQEALYS
jgi:hypothetical protein